MYIKVNEFILYFLLKNFCIPEKNDYLCIAIEKSSCSNQKWWT